SGLTGRGGAGFPTGRKLRSVAAGARGAGGAAPGAGGEAGGRKDRAAVPPPPPPIPRRPAPRGSPRRPRRPRPAASSPGARGACAAALAERGARDGARVPIQPRATRGRCVASEQSAIVQSLNGGPAKPTSPPPRPHQRGVRGRPTLVNNVETLAHLALIARFGDRWFRAAGLPSAPGTALATVSGAVRRPGVYEIELGIPAGQVVMMAGGPAERPAARLVGGSCGAWLPAGPGWPVPMCHAALKAAGGAMGAGIVVVLPVSSCGLAETARVIRYLAGQNAGQCGPCMFGLPALAHALADPASQGGRGRAVERVAALAGLVDGRGACRHPDGAAQLVRSALRAFAADALRHDQRGPCPGAARAPLLRVPGDGGRDWA